MSVMSSCFSDPLYWDFLITMAFFILKIYDLKLPERAMELQYGQNEIKDR